MKVHTQNQVQHRFRLELDPCMPITLQDGTQGSLDEVLEEMAAWQRDELPIQLHPGDLGWNRSLGAQALGESVRVWRRDGETLAVGMVDDQDGLIRMSIAPSVDHDEAFAAHLLADLSDPERGVLPAGTGSVEARFGTAFRRLLARRGWPADEPWTPLSRDLAEPVEDSGLRVESIDAQHVRDRIVADRIAVHRAAFTGSTFGLERWRAMAAGSAYGRARCLVGYDEDDAAVAAATVWSAGTGRPGLLEPLGVHRDHRGQGHGRAISVAAAAALREMGSSSASVCTPSSNVGGVATYVAAGFRTFCGT